MVNKKDSDTKKISIKNTTHLGKYLILRNPKAVSSLDQGLRQLRPSGAARVAQWASAKSAGPIQARVRILRPVA
ncbi:MAG: hypothetical protein R6W85_01905, partial [Gillisia sp.]